MELKQKLIIDFNETKFITPELIDLIFENSKNYNFIIRNANNHIVDLLDCCNAKEHGLKFE
jgi:hypothetical protein